MGEQEEEVSAELRQHVNAFVSEQGSLMWLLVQRAHAEGSAYERRELVRHLDAQIAERTAAFASLDGADRARIEAVYAGMPGSAVANAEAGGAGEVLFTLRQRLTQPQPARSDE